MIDDDLIPLGQEYYGSKKFQFVADFIGLPVDQVNFLLAQIFALSLAYYFRVCLRPGKVSAAKRHWAALSAGTLISYFCFGKQIILAVFLLILCYAILVLLPSNIFHHATLVVSLVFLGCVHLHKQNYFDGKYIIDVTGPLMIIVQKASSLAYSLHDGLYKEESKMTEMQKKYKIKSRPSPVEYFGYLACFQSILVGPYFMFTEYQDFINGTQYVKWAAVQKAQKASKSGTPIETTSINNNCSDKFTMQINGNGSSSVKSQLPSNKPELPASDFPTPLDGYANSEELRTFRATGDVNPNRFIKEKLIASFLCSLLTILVLPHFSIEYLKEKAFLESSFAYKVFYILLTTTMARQLYYTAWTLTDAICAMSGLGFNGFDKDGNSKWDLITNVKIWDMETSLNLKETLESWNIGTMIWLRFLVYERARYLRTFFTYMLSSVWHGFYPGYYLTFMGGAIFTQVARKIRRHLRPRILQCGSNVKFTYDVCTCIATKLCLSYLTFPFVLLKFWPSLYVYHSLGYYLHVIGFLLFVGIVPFVSKLDQWREKYTDSKSSSGGHVENLKPKKE